MSSLAEQKTQTVYGADVGCDPGAVNFVLLTVMRDRSLLRRSLLRWC